MRPDVGRYPAQHYSRQPLPPLRRQTTGTRVSLLNTSPPVMLSAELPADTREQPLSWLTGTMLGLAVGSSRSSVVSELQEM